MPPYNLHQYITAAGGGGGGGRRGGGGGGGDSDLGGGGGGSGRRVCCWLFFSGVNNLYVVFLGVVKIFENGPNDRNLAFVI